MSRVRKGSGAVRKKTRRPVNQPKDQKGSAPQKTDHLVLQLQKSIGNLATQGVLASGPLTPPSIQRTQRPVPLASLSDAEREKFGAAQQQEAIKGIRWMMRALKRAAQNKPTQANQWRYAHAVTIWRKYSLSGDMVSCHNALVSRLSLPRKQIKTIRYIGAFSPKQAPTIEQWWKGISEDFATLGKQLAALGYSARFTKIHLSPTQGKLPMEAYFRTPAGKIIGPITWRQMVPAMQFLIKKHNKWAATPEDFVYSVLHSKMDMDTRLRNALLLWSTNQMQDDRYMTRANVSHVSNPKNDWKLGRVPDTMTSFAHKIHQAWSVASNYSRKSGPSQSKFIKEMAAVHAEVVDGIKAIVSGGNTIFYGASNKQFKLVETLKAKSNTVLNCLHKY